MVILPHAYHWHLRYGLFRPPRGLPLAKREQTDPAASGLRSFGLTPTTGLCGKGSSALPAAYYWPKGNDGPYRVTSARCQPQAYYWPLRQEGSLALPRPSTGQRESTDHAVSLWVVRLATAYHWPTSAKGPQIVLHIARALSSPVAALRAPAASAAPQRDAREQRRIFAKFCAALPRWSRCANFSVASAWNV